MSKTPDNQPVSVLGDLWIMGEHKLLCGDSTKPEDTKRLMGNKKAVLIHADPPYGMGKENEGIANDNLYRDKLDAFQMEWWRALRPHVADNGSVYIWGNAKDLWRLWYIGGLRDSERLTFRNEIIWDKPFSGMGDGQNNSIMRSYGIKTERCLFFMRGEQGFNNNADNYWEGWEPIRRYLKTELAKVGDIKWAKRAAGHSETSGCHWFDKSQWTFPTREVYISWQVAAREHDAFKREYDDLKREFYATRAYFDNTHENMTDVWQYDRVKNEERHGHATPKPVAMVCRILKSSSPDGSIVVDPFCGSGPTIIAAERLGRKCYAIEIEPRYIDVTVRRWQNFTGKKAVLERGGKRTNIPMPPWECAMPLFTDMAAGETT